MRPKHKKGIPVKAPTIVLSILAVPLVGLSIASVVASVTSAQDAIDAITAQDKVNYSAQSQSLIDSAIKAVEAITPGFDLKYRIQNLDNLTAAKAEYVRLAIKTAAYADQRRMLEERTPQEIAQLILDARQAANTYLSEEEHDLVSNYSDLLRLEQDEAYSVYINNSLPAESAQATGASSETAAESCEVDLC